MPGDPASGAPRLHGGPPRPQRGGDPRHHRRRAGRRACVSGARAFEVLVVENGSTDDTAASADSARGRAPRGRRPQRPDPGLRPGPAPGPARRRGPVRRQLRRGLLRPGVPRPRPRRSSATGRASSSGTKRGEGAQDDRPIPRRARHLGLRHAAAGDVRPAGVGHARHEGPRPGARRRRSRSGASSAPTCSTPSWCYGRSGPGSSSPRSPSASRSGAPLGRPSPGAILRTLVGLRQLRLALREE